MMVLVAAPILLAMMAPTDVRSEALAVIERLGGRYYADPHQPGYPVVSVALSNAGAGGEGLKCLAVFPELRELDLKDLEDADRQLVHLAGLRQVRELSLDRTSLTDAGMRHIRGLVNLETLTFGSTAVGDEGLKTIGRLRKLKVLNLSGSKITIRRPYP